MKKTIALFLTFVMMFTLFAGCADKQEKADITVALMDKGRCSAEEGDMENNRWTRYINESSSVKVEFISIARDNFEENLNLLIASGTIPDIMLTYEATYVQQLINQDLIQPIDGLIEEYSTTCKKYLADNPEIVDYLKFNGEMYAISNKNANTLDQGLWIRQDWLDKLNLEMPKTEEEFLNVCREFKKAKLGGENTVPLALMKYYWGYFSPMYDAYDQWYVNDEGKIEYGVLTERFAKSTSILKTCYDEGLISKEFAADIDSSLATKSWVNGESGILLYKASPALMKELLENDPSANPVPLAPFETEYGKKGLIHSKDIGAYVVLSSKAKNPEAAIKYLDWLLEDGWFTLQYGFEGVHHTLDDSGYPVVTEGDEINTQMKYTSAYILLSQNTVTEQSIMATAAKDDLSQKIAKLEVDSMKVNGELDFRRDIPNGPDVDEYGVLYADWSLIEQRIMVKAITGGTNYTIKDMMVDLEKEWLALEGDEVQEKVQQWYDQSKK